MALFSVSIQECGGRRRTWSTRVRTADEREARDRAIAKIWGRRASWWADSGIGPDYGQVIEPQGGSPGAYNCLTPRVHVRVD